MRRMGSIAGIPSRPASRGIFPRRRFSRSPGVGIASPASEPCQRRLPRRWVTNDGQVLVDRGTPLRHCAPVGCEPVRYCRRVPGRVRWEPWPSGPITCPGAAGLRQARLTGLRRCLARGPPWDGLRVPILLHHTRPARAVRCHPLCDAAAPRQARGSRDAQEPGLYEGNRRRLTAASGSKLCW